jgi:hypothetical protein
MMSAVRQDVLQILAELSEVAPEVRLGQLIVNLSYLARGLSNESIWDMEDDELLAAARRHLEEWRSRRMPVVKPRVTPHLNREDYLRQRLNTFLTRELGLPVADYYGQLSIKALLSLKSTLADINNIFTLKICLHFINWLAHRFQLREEDAVRIQESVLATKPNANGFDVHVPNPIKAIAEVKCNVPMNEGSKYGAAQRDRIEKDVTALLEGKSKVQVDPKDYLKFLVFLDRPAIRRATDHLMRTSKVCKDKLIDAPEASELDKRDVVYVVYVGRTKDA